MKKQNEENAIYKDFQKECDEVIKTLSLEKISEMRECSERLKDDTIKKIKENRIFFVEIIVFALMAVFFYFFSEPIIFVIVPSLIAVFIFLNNMLAPMREIYINKIIIYNLDEDINKYFNISR